jgi:hypothetical protein
MPETITWRGRLAAVPDVQRMLSWVIAEGVCETPDGEPVELGHRDGWLALLGLI